MFIQDFFRDEPLESVILDPSAGICPLGTIDRTPDVLKAAISATTTERIDDVLSLGRFLL